MKYLYLAIFLLAISCGGLNKKGETKEETETNLKEKTVTEKPEKVTEKLLLVLKNPDKVDNAKMLVKNSGLTWNKMAFENETTKIGEISVPAEKKDFWIDRLKQTGTFKAIKPNSKTTLDAMIKRAKSAFFTFRKTECFGDCPSYDVSIDNKGNVIYNGLKYVTETGKREFTLTEKEFALLQEKLKKKKFSEYKKIYDDPNLMDLPSTYMSYKGKQVQIRLWKGIPKDLIDVHEYVQGILLDKKYFE